MIECCKSNCTKKIKETDPALGEWSLYGGGWYCPACWNIEERNI